jgi:peptidyl-tRNA hydrolase
MNKLYVVVRDDLSDAQKAVQATHAALQFSHEHRDSFTDWVTGSNILVVLEVRDETHLESIVRLSSDSGVKYSKFYEPDIGNKLTAVALECKAKKICGRLPLAFTI